MLQVVKSNQICFNKIDQWFKFGLVYVILTCLLSVQCARIKLKKNRVGWKGRSRLSLTRYLTNEEIQKEQGWMGN